MKSEEIKPWRELYDADCEESETGFSRWNAESYMQDEIDELRVALVKLEADFQATVDYMNEGCICGRAPDPKHPVDKRLCKPTR